MDNEQQIKEKNFVEEFGIVFEQMGVPRMAGRILSRLLISDPPHQSTDKLAAALSASKGSISTTTRFLIQLGMIERFSLPGIRHDYFRIRPGSLNHLTKQKAAQMTTLRQLAERGLELVKDKNLQIRQGLEEMRDIYTFFEREFPALVERWEQEHQEKQASARQFVRKEH